MKIYLLLFTASITLLILGSVITIAIPEEESFSDQLVQTPEKWNIEFTENGVAGIWIASDAVIAKSLLLSFLSKNRRPSYRKVEHIAYDLMIVCAFSFVGLIRETRFKRGRI